MDQCPGLIGGVNDASTSCNIVCSIQETILGVMDALPGSNPVTGWGTNASVPSASSSALSSTSAAPTPSSSSTGMSTTGYGYTTSSGSSGSSSTTAVPTQTSSPTSSSTASTGAPAGWTYSGCYSDNASNRALNGIEFADLGIGKVTTTGCISYCGEQGFTMAGTEYAGQVSCIIS